MQFVLFLIIALIAFVLATQLHGRNEMSQRLAAMGVSPRFLSK